MQGPQLRARVGAEPVGQQAAYVLVGGQSLGGAARLVQGAQPQRLEGFVQRVGVAQGGQLGQRLLGVAEGEGGGEPGAAHVQVAGLPAGGLGAGVGQVGQRGPAPQGQGVVEDAGRLGRIAVGQRPQALAGQPFETVQVHVVGRGGQPVAALGGGDRLGAQRPAQPADQRLQRARGVGGRVVAPPPLDQQAPGNRTAGAPGQHGQQGAQPCPADRDDRAVGAEGLRGAEDAIAHGVHCVRGRGGTARRFPRIRSHRLDSGPRSGGTGARQEPRTAVRRWPCDTGTVALPVPRHRPGALPHDHRHHPPR